jgi:hypothetical protein
LLSPVKRRPALLAVVRSKNKDDASFTDRILDYIEGNIQFQPIPASSGGCQLRDNAQCSE